MLRCIHRHTILTHPNCFRLGLVKKTDDIKESPKSRVSVTEKKESKWYDGMRIGYLDIEADGLKADFATMLSWAIKERDGGVMVDVVNKKELFSELGDRRIIESLLKAMKGFDILCGYYSTNYDLKFIRSKALHYGLEFPEFGSVYHWDIYYLVRSRLSLSSKSLESVCDYLGIHGKTRLDKDIWRLAKYGNKDALDEVVDHNIGDVVILEQLHNRLEGQRKWTKLSA